jgi:hypothetical protein
MKPNETPESGTTVVRAIWPSETLNENLGEAAATASPLSSNDTEEGNVTTHGDNTATMNDVTKETAPDSTISTACSTAMPFSAGSFARKSTLKRYAHRGWFTPLRIGPRMVRYRRKDVIAFENRGVRGVSDAAKTSQ